MGQALYRDYRPTSFDEVVGQDHITQTLKNALKGGKISHAYLFTGPKGVGKTSVARILAHEVNELPYTDESIHLDIIEIDAASNRRIDEIRDLRDKVRIAPTSGKYKVYIIDEVHMLTREAFNALLKTLEEPPAHCIFILATTEAPKLPDTIVSRTQRFEFKPVSRSRAAEHLQLIAKQEKIDITKEALEILAEYGNGSFRDSISYLDQLSSYGKKIGADEVRQLLGLPASTEIKNLSEYIESGNAAEVLNKLKTIEQRGVSPQAIANSLSAAIREDIINGRIKAGQIELLSRLVDVSASHRPQEALEISLLSVVSSKDNQPSELPVDQIRKTVALDVVKTDMTNSDVLKTKKSQASGPFSLEQWDEVVELSKKQAASVYTALRLARPRLDDKKLVLCFDFPLHQKKLEQAKNKELVSQLIEDVSGSKLIIESVVEKSAPVIKMPPIKQAEEPVNAISNIFGAAEVIEA